MAEAIEANSGKIGTLGHGYTYGGHPVACAVGVKALEIYQPARHHRPGPRRSRRASPATSTGWPGIRWSARRGTSG